MHDIVYLFVFDGDPRLEGLIWVVMFVKKPRACCLWNMDGEDEL